MKRILVFGMTENPGGVESVILNYYRHIDRTKIQFDFLCNSFEPVAYEEELLALGGKTFHFPARSRDYLGYRKAMKAFFAANAAEYAAIWVNVCSLANIDYLIYAKKYGIPKRIIHSHNSQNMDSKLRGLLHRYNKKRIAKFATDFWTCSEEAADWFYDKPIRSAVVLIRNAVDVEAMGFAPLARKRIRQERGWEDCYILGNVGRLHFQKNQTFALDILEKLVRDVPSARLVLIGQGEDERKLRDKVRQQRLEPYVLFAGVRSNINEWLSAFDLFLFPSLFEGLSVVAMEAQANGLPVLASGGVIPEEVRINENFTFFDLKQPAQAWADRIKAMKENGKRSDPEKIRRNFLAAGYDIEHEAERVSALLLGEGK